MSVIMLDLEIHYGHGERGDTEEDILERYQEQERMWKCT